MSIAKTPGPASVRLVLRFAGAGLLIATAAIHLDLYLTGYRTIPTIGWLFLLQVIVAFALGALVLVTGNRLVAAAGAGFALSTLGGYLLTVQFGLFGFREVRTTAGIVAGIIEVAGFAALAVLAAMPATAAGRGAEPTLDGVRMSSQQRAAAAWAHGVPHAGLAVAGVCVVALALLGGALAAAGGTAPASTGPSASTVADSLQTEKVGGTTVLANSHGLTLYWFAPDTSTKSVCNGSCAQYWPPVPGPAHAGNGVSGSLGTIRRADGTVQATFDGHPLYTYIGDSGPGQAHGNNLNLNGGLWHEIVLSH
jgi:predicted lipoprotein with Yx(FWY)xxD motif